MSPKNQKTILPAFEVDESADDLGVSPVTGLSINLGNRLQIRRNLTFHSNESTPVKSHEQNEAASEPHRRSSEISPTFSSLKNGGKFGRKALADCSPTNGICRRFSFPTRRLNDDDDDDDDKENNEFVDGQRAPSIRKMYKSPNSKVKCVSLRSRPPLEEHDSNSQDSCYSSSSSRFSSDDSSSASSFRFTEPMRLPLKRINTGDSLSPLSKSSFSSPLFSRKRRPKLFLSASTGSEFSDDDFVDHFPISSSHFMDQDENAQFPDGFGSLLSGTIVNRLEQIKEVSFTESEAHAPEQSETPVRSNWKAMMQSKSMSAPVCESSPVSPFFGGLEDRRSGKRTAECSDVSPSFLKRRKSEKSSPTASNILRSKLKMTSEWSTSVQQQSLKGTIFNYGFTKTTVKKLQRSFSETEVTIEKALERATSNPNLIGNFTKPLALPIHMDCKHSDLKNISCCTLAKVINGEYSHSINSYKIIDCRYPYEYEGGHIKDAVNLYTEQQIMRELMEPCLHQPPTDTMPDNKRDILIFHCEFSSKRGPNLLRYLRNIDRSRNTYPSLNYPEIYLLDGGYRAFYDKYVDLCEPRAYLPMNSREHRSMYSMFKQKSKSCSNFGETQARNFPKRLGL